MRRQAPHRCCVSFSDQTSCCVGACPPAATFAALAASFASLAAAASVALRAFFAAFAACPACFSARNASISWAVRRLRLHGPPMGNSSSSWTPP